MKRALVGTAGIGTMLGIMLFSMSAFAGKAERDYMTNEVQPAVKAAETKFKASCGCALKINVSDTLKTRDELAQARNVANSITESAEAYCNDAASKKAMCQLKTLDIVKGKDTAFTFKGSTGTSTTDGQSYAHWDMMTRELDK